MLSSKGILHKLVISLSDGKKLGEIEDLYLDPDLREVVGLYLGSEGLIKRKDKFLPRAAVQLTGMDAWLVADSGSVTTTDKIPEISTLTLIENLRGREVQTTGGTKLGIIDEVLLDADLLVLGFGLGKVFIQGPLAEKKFIVRSSVSDLGGPETPMIADLSLAEAGVTQTIE